MRDSLSYYQVIKAPEQAEDSELAACLAAVSYYICTEKSGVELERESSLDAGRSGVRSCWQAASYLEQSRCAASTADLRPLGAMRGNKRSLWAASGLMLSLVLCLATTYSAAAAATTYDTSSGDAIVKQDESLSSREMSSPADERNDRPNGWYLASNTVSPSRTEIAGKPSPTEYLRRMQADGKIAVRIGLAVNVADIFVDTMDGADVLDLSNGKQVASLHPMTQWRFSARTAPGGSTALVFSGRRAVDKYALALGERSPGGVRNVAYFPGAAAVSPMDAPPPVSNLRSLPGQTYSITGGVLLVPSQASPDSSTSFVFSLNGRMYRGALWIKSATVKDASGCAVTRLTAVNILDVEDYLKSVLPSEMPSSWPEEALKAQAIAARSYALANFGKYDSQGFDIKASVLDQVYRGVAAETVSSSSAVARTRGVVMKHNGQIVPALFHATSGGCTDLAENVWTRELTFLKSVPDHDSKSKYQSWERKVSLDQLDKLFAKDTGTILGAFPVDRSTSGRVRNMLIVGTQGAALVPGTRLREAFGLPSTNFNVLADQNSYVFKGQGFGHGLGMSQWGARTLAEHGYNAGQILNYYYKDVTFEQLVETPAL